MIGAQRRAGDLVRAWRAFWSRFARDARGNTLIIVAGAMLPLICLIGSGIDIGRGYLAQSRLQQACDAAALAGRRAMSAGVVDATVRDEATKFFKFNFPIGDSSKPAAFGAASFTPTVGSAPNSTVTVTATTTLPTTIMRMFGFRTLPLGVTCFAKQDFVNTDIMLVVDTTGSMAWDVSGRNVNSGSTSRIAGLRSAVMALYDELAPVQTQLEAAGLRLRYGIVPYSSTVNVGKVVQAMNPSYIASDTAVYQTRQPQYDTRGVTRDACAAQGGSWQITNIFALTGTCSKAAFNGQYNYNRYPVDVSKFVASSGRDNIPDPTSGVGGSASGWKGCIEERQTVSTITTSPSYTIPTGAYDLNIDYIPNSDATRWTPQWPDMIYLRNEGGQRNNNSALGSAACPAEAVRLKAFTRSEMQTYVNALQATGSTYHDIGMIWGTRMLSNAGVFAADNPTKWGNMPVSRHIIFLTDGAMEPDVETYSAYGVEYMDQRVAGNAYVTNSNLKSRHIQRLRMVCQAAKNKGASIWVIAFAVGGTLDPSLPECASNPAQFSTSDSQQDLIDRFAEIGKNIGALRLTE
jgi:Flp pilus assembly protein TadG